MWPNPTDELYRGIVLDHYHKPRNRGSLKQPSVSGEADNVLLITDISPKTYAGYQENQDDEIRVFYVAATRTKKNLHIITPRTQRYFDL